MPDPRPIEDIIAKLRESGVLGTGVVARRPLSGGVSCDIWLLEEGASRVVVKQALPKLRVKDDWFADVGRNATEQAYIGYVGRFRPDAVPRILHADPGLGFFAMEFLGDGYENWKAQMLMGRADPETARRAGALLGEIHRRSWGDADLRATFDTTANFHQLRTESYLLTTGRRHPGMRELFEEEAARMEATRLCLAHGDFSPKNILVADERIVLLDCEVAWYGEPAFDAAFLLNHLHLKALHNPPMCGEFLNLAAEALGAYRGALGTDRFGDMDARTARQLLMQMLARIDGKSPVEYLTQEAKRDAVRAFVGEHLPGGLWREGVAGVSCAWGRMVSFNIQ
ncbi:MAG: phosphotransferase [Verrucomicrobiae bacterium]|nr:phosphotransferase [Verrucomicrobiae bacterium]